MKIIVKVGKYVPKQLIFLLNSMNTMALVFAKGWRHKFVTKTKLTFYGKFTACHLVYSGTGAASIHMFNIELMEPTMIPFCSDLIP